MKQNSEKTRVRFLQALAIGACYVWLIVRPEDASLAAAGALSLCAKVIVPSLFPFFVCANLFCALHLTQPLERALSGVMQPVFGVPGSGAAALVVGLTGGYPSGAQTIAALYAAGSIDKKAPEGFFCSATTAVRRSSSASWDRQCSEAGLPGCFYTSSIAPPRCCWELSRAKKQPFFPPKMQTPRRKLHPPFQPPSPTASEKPVRRRSRCACSCCSSAC